MIEEEAHMSGVIRLVLIAALLLRVSLAQAALVTWTLQSVTFDDGGTATGSFTLDTAKIDPKSLGNPIASFDIKTTPGTSVTTEAEYSSSAPGAAAQSFYVAKEARFPGEPPGVSHDARIGIFIPDPADPNNFNKDLRELLLGFNDDLNAAGGTVNVAVSFGAGLEFIRSEAGGASGLFAERAVVGGSVSAPAVPEPDAYAFACLGAALLLLFRGRFGNDRR
jgi:hypothetical protein